VEPRQAQPTLFDASELDTEGIPSLPTIRERFEEFHRRNPEVYREIRRRCDELIRAGVRRFGMRLVWERMRWDHAVQTQGEPWKLNDHYIAHYARLAIRDLPELGKVLELRALRSEGEGE
jgi:hypothetical protein